MMMYTMNDDDDDYKEPVRKMPGIHLLRGDIDDEQAWLANPIL